MLFLSQTNNPKIRKKKIKTKQQQQSIQVVLANYSWAKALPQTVDDIPQEWSKLWYTCICMQVFV